MRVRHRVLEISRQVKGKFLAIVGVYSTTGSAANRPSIDLVRQLGGNGYVVGSYKLTTVCLTRSRYCVDISLHVLRCSLRTLLAKTGKYLSDSPLNLLILLFFLIFALPLFFLLQQLNLPAEFFDLLCGTVQVVHNPLLFLLVLMINTQVL